MNNNFYIHQGLMDESNVEICLTIAIDLCRQKSISNIGLMLNNKNLINEGFVSKFIADRTGMSTDDVSKLLVKTSIYRFVAEGIGLNIYHENNFNIQGNNKTISLIIYTYPITLTKLLKKISAFNNDVVLCLPSNDQEFLDEVLKVINGFNHTLF